MASTAEELMRSRYCAFVSANIDYLLKTHYKSTRPNKNRNQILAWTKSVRWMGLEVLNSQKGMSHDSEGYVEFKAVFEENGKLDCIHEKSYFVKENNSWYYKSGIHK